jgi:hypothetical protein
MGPAVGVSAKWIRLMIRKKKGITTTASDVSHLRSATPTNQPRLPKAQQSQKTFF